MPKQKVTLKQVAAAADLAIPTVSQILNGRSNFCSEDQRARVRKIAGELGYMPNIGYRIMTGQETQTVAILLSMPQHNDSEHGMKLVRYLIDEFDAIGYAAYCSVFSQSSEENLKKIHTLIRRGVSHFVFLGCPYGYQEILQEIQKGALHHIGAYPPFPRYVANGTDQGIKRLLQELYERVGRNFKLIYDMERSQESNRMKALLQLFPNETREALFKEFFFEAPKADFQSEHYRNQAIANGEAATEALLSAHPDIGGIAYLNDDLATGGVRCLMKPENKKFRNLILTGCNNAHTLSMLPLPVTSFAFDLKQQAVLLARRVLDDAPCIMDVPGTLHVRTPDQNAANYPQWSENIIKLK